MQPIGWSKRSVQLQCDICGSHTRLELLPYLSALKRGIPLQCPGCGARAGPRHRRQDAAARTAKRRVVIQT
jgi:hypothetical protein